MSKYKFKGVFIPASVWISKDMTPAQKMLLCEIDAMSGGKSDPCYATNSHFSKHLGLSKDSVKNMISKLEKLGYLKRKYKDNDKNSTRYMWVDFNINKDNATPASHDATPASHDATPASHDATINKLSIREEEEEVYFSISDDKKRKRFKKLMDFINFVKYEYIGISIEVKGKNYFIDDDGYMKTKKDGKKISVGLAKEIFKRMYEMQDRAIDYFEYHKANRNT